METQMPLLNYCWKHPDYFGPHSICFFHMECLVSPQGHCHVHTVQSFAFSYTCASGADVGSSSWAPHPWLDLAQPAGTEATWHPCWPACVPHLWVDVVLGWASISGCALLLVMLTPALPPDKQSRRACLSHAECLLCYNLYFENSTRSFWGRNSVAFAGVNFHKSLRLIQLLQLRDGGITL